MIVKNRTNKLDRCKIKIHVLRFHKVNWATYNIVENINQLSLSNAIENIKSQKRIFQTWLNVYCIVRIYIHILGWF